MTASAQIRARHLCLWCVPFVRCVGGPLRRRPAYTTRLVCVCVCVCLSVCLYACLSAPPPRTLPTPSLGLGAPHLRNHWPTGYCDQVALRARAPLARPALAWRAVCACTQLARRWMRMTTMRAADSPNRPGVGFRFGSLWPRLATPGQRACHWFAAIRFHSSSYLFHSGPLSLPLCRPAAGPHTRFGALHWRQPARNTWALGMGLTEATAILAARLYLPAPCQSARARA